jgi:hypothetical protein
MVRLVVAIVALLLVASAPLSLAFTPLHVLGPATTAAAVNVAVAWNGRHFVSFQNGELDVDVEYDDDGDIHDFSPLTHEVYWLDDKEDGNNGHGQEEENNELLYDDVLDDPRVENDKEEESSPSLGQAIAQGQAVVCIPNMAIIDECNSLFAAGLQASQARGPDVARGRHRFSVADPTAFDNDIVLTCDEILLRVLDYLDENMPSIYQYLFHPSDSWARRQPLNARLEQPTVPPEEYVSEMASSLRELYTFGLLEWSEGEPAINIYQGGGYFGAHKDHLALTVLIPLTSPQKDFSGGGTGFWSGNRETSENPGPHVAPHTCLKPPPGSALVFGGDVTHAGMPVKAGYRSVFVCSFSTKTPVSPADRLHGLQTAPLTSPTFKGTL